MNLDLSLVLLQQGRTAEVKALAGEMLAFFESQGIEREALAAVRLFCEGARQEAATVELAQRVRRFLRRAKLDPGLKFEGARGRRKGDSTGPPCAAAVSSAGLLHC